MRTGRYLEGDGKEKERGWRKGLGSEFMRDQMYNYKRKKSTSFILVAETERNVSPKLM